MHWHLSIHNLISITYNIEVKRRGERAITCRDFRCFNEGEFLSEVQNFDWSFSSWSLLIALIKRWRCWIQRCLNALMFMHRLGEYRCLLHGLLRNSRRRWEGETWLDVCGVEEEMMWVIVSSRVCAIRFSHGAKSNYYLAIFNQSDNPANTWKLHRLELVKEKN